MVKHTGSLCRCLCTASQAAEEGRGLVCFVGVDRKEREALTVLGAEVAAPSLELCL